MIIEQRNKNLEDENTFLKEIVFINIINTLINLNTRLKSNLLIKKT